MPLWKQFLTACLLAFSSMLFSCNALVGNDKTLGKTIPFVMADDNPANPQLTVSPPNVIFGSILQIDTTAKPSCSTLMGDTISIETITQGMTIEKPVKIVTPEEVLPLPPIEQVDTPQTILTGKIAYDTSRFIDNKTIDTVKGKKDLPGCDNEFIKL